MPLARGMFCSTPAMQKSVKFWLSAAATVATSTRGVNIAKRWDTSVPGDFFDGMIPMALVYNKVLSASDITLVYNQFKPRYP